MTLPNPASDTSPRHTQAGPFTLATAGPAWVDIATVAFFAEQGWQVKRVGQYKLGYDLVCANLDGAILHVEVKGTRTLGEKVTLTANEVEHVRRAADCGAEHILYVVSEITVTGEDETLTCSGGTATRLRPSLSVKLA